MKNNYNEMTIEELNAEEKKLRSELFNLVFSKSVNQLTDNSSIRKIKKNIARVLTAKTLRLKKEIEE